MTAQNQIGWLSDLIRAEIALWDRVNARLRREHGLSLAFFEALYFVGGAPDGTLRVGNLARALRITVGATSKLVDRVEAAGLMRRELDADDRRASRVALTAAGEQMLAAASVTYAAEVAAILDPALAADEQEQLHTLVQRLLTALAQEEAA